MEKPQQFIQDSETIAFNKEHRRIINYNIDYNIVYKKNEGYFFIIFCLYVFNTKV